MASLLRPLSRSVFMVARRGPTRQNASLLRAIGAPTRSFTASTRKFISEDPPEPPPPKQTLPEDLPPLPENSTDNMTKEERSMYDMMSADDREHFDAAYRELAEEFNDPEKRAKAFAEIERTVNRMERDDTMRFEDVQEKGRGFWSEEEEDEFCLVEDGDEDFNDDEITSMAHAELELHREIREYARIAAWDMPSLSRFAKPYTLPPETHVLRFRYTTYLGEVHPAESKVVVELASKDLTPKYLSEEQRLTFLKLVGPRYNPDTDIVKMSCEKFSSRAQNKRYLGDLVNTLIKEAKEGDSFADIPLDQRHHKPKVKLTFPKEWVMTEHRRKQLAARRADQQRQEVERAAIVDGNAILAEAVVRSPALNPALRAKLQEPEKVRARVAAKGAPKLAGRPALRSRRTL